MFDLTQEEFKENYLDKNIYFQKSAHRLDFEWSDVDQTLFSWDPADQMLRLVKGGETLTENVVETFTDIGRTRQKIIKDKLYKELTEGATLLLNRLDLKNAKINDITFQLGQFIGERAISNGYCSFGKEPAFNKHWDTHDVFAVQLIGRKHWKVFGPSFEQPLVHQKSKEYIAECPSTPVFEVCLEAGDILYIPKGWWHEVHPVEGEPTCHIAVGIHGMRVKDYFSWICNTQLDGLLDFRKPLHNGDTSVPDLQAAIEHFSEMLKNRSLLEQFHDLVAIEERVNSRFDLERGALPKSAERASENVVLNSAYRVTPGPKRRSINGFQVAFDEKSLNALVTAIEKPEEGYSSARDMIENLIKADVISITSIRKQQ